MGLAFETTVGNATNPGATVTAVTMVTGDTNRVRSFSASAYARLESIFRQGATEGVAGVRSPAFHDAVRGIRFITSETPSRFDLPTETGEPLASADTLTIEVSGGTAEVDAVGVSIYYSDTQGLAARLHSWGDISGFIEHIKPLEVDWTTNGTANVWQDTVITTTEDLLIADRSYAVLGYILDTAMTAFGVKGQETGNVRHCGPGSTTSLETNDYFVRLSNQRGTPHIPIVSANNKGSIFVTGSAVATGSAVKSQLILALLAKSFAG